MGEMVKWMRITLFVLPTFISNGESDVDLGDGVCFIPHVDGGFTAGNAMFLEDCDTLEEFETIPHPAEDMFNHHGVHPVVCCPPQPLPDDYDYEYNGSGDFPVYLNTEDYDTDSAVSSTDQKDAVKYCVESEECVALNKCSDQLENSNAPVNQTFTCGFDKSLNLVKICCQKDKVETQKRLAQSPRFPNGENKARKVEDKTEQCKKWARNGACNLDNEFNITTVPQENMLDFMFKSCMGTCGWAPGGCYDEHERCQEWARLGHCLKQGYFM